DAWMAEFLLAGPEMSVDGDRLTLSGRGGTVMASAASGGPGGTTVPGSPDDPVSSPTMPQDPDDPTLPDPGSGTVPEGPIPVEPNGGAGGPLGGDGGGTSGSPGAAALWGSRWEIVGIDGAAPLPARNGAAPVLDTEVEGRVAYTGCNGGSADASIDGDRLLAGGFLSTKMACAGADGEALMAQDARLAELLGASPTIAIEGDRLLLTAAEGEVEAVRR
ncbi:MAG TPA: META domain-containing protein, partial [Aquihabitans sp.]|nr:META domain-containing protein [Aquihabitans sp.]